jgi:hypothetical protein
MKCCFIPYYENKLLRDGEQKEGYLWQDLWYWMIKIICGDGDK